MPTPPIQVYIVDDDPSICVAYARLMRSAQIAARTFASVEEFVGADFKDENACVISDVQFPGRSGLDLPVLLGRAGHLLPVIFVTAHDTPETRDIAQRFGAVGYYRKPVDDLILLGAITAAVERPATP